MKSIKPGRGPSMHSAVGSIFMVVFGVIWTLIAIGMTWDAGIIGLLFPLFGLVFIGQGIYSAVVSFKNAKGKDRMSLYDIVDESEEKDPWDPTYDPNGPTSYSQPGAKKEVISAHTAASRWNRIINSAKTAENR